MKKIISLCLITLFPFFLLSGCKKGEDSPAGKLIRYYLEGEPQNLDPQLSNDPSSLLVVRNIFEGLVRLNENGEPRPGVASRWESNSDHTSFTFYLREDARWSDGSPVTADDFVFGIRRSVLPETGCPSFEETVACIKNARAIHDGSANPDSLGVYAADAHTLVIELETPFSDFPSQTAKAPFMPCQEKFFSLCMGKYGLETKYILSNGPFSIREKNGWRHGQYVRLELNENYAGENSPLPSGVLLTVSEPPEDVVGALMSEDASLDASPLPADQLEEAMENGLSVTSFTDTTWGICVNTKTPVFENKKVRQAFFSSINREIALSAIPSGGTATDGILPPQLTLLGEPYRELAGNLNLPYLEPAQTRQLLADGLAELGSGSLPTLTLLCLDDMASKTLANNLVACWKDGLGHYLRIDPVSESELKSRVSSGNYQLAIYPLQAFTETPVDFLEQFSSESALNLWGYSSGEFDSLLQQASNNHDTALDFVQQAEQLLLDDGIFYPLHEENSYYAMGPTVSNILFLPFQNGADFFFAGKTEKRLPSSST